VGVLLFRMLFGDFPFKSINMEYEINSKCVKGFNLKKMKLRHNPSVNKEAFELLTDLFNKVFKINPNERISV
jgi:serine/threonine protein kinase